MPRLNTLKPDHKASRFARIIGLLTGVVLSLWLAQAGCLAQPQSAAQPSGMKSAVSGSGGLAVAARTAGGESSGARQAAAAPATSAPAKPEGVPSQQDLQAARAQVRENPSNPKARFALAELLRRAGRHREAAQEYLQATDLDPTYYICYHLLATINADAGQIDDGIARLSKLQEEKPKELMLRVALSELMERRGDYYPAARVLVDLVYQNAVPVKYQPKINARIHYLLIRAKEAQNVESNTTAAEEELDALPPPLPESSFRKDIPASKIKESRVMRGVGHAPLLP